MHPLNKFHVGNRWYKCDLHLHTPASQCFADRSVTADQWVKRAEEVGLNCVAVTDHNSGEWIDQIKAVAPETLHVFPGTEITCSDAKIHLLVLFDTSADRRTIENFLTRAKINQKDFGAQGAMTSMSVAEVVAVAISMGGLVIPAHIDDFNGLSIIADTIQKELLASPDIKGVQAVHKPLLEKNLNMNANEAIESYFSSYYGSAQFGKKEIQNSYNCVQLALACSKALLTFSDNPHEESSTQHGIWGIGSRVTWLKMNNPPTLEGLRQALIFPEFRAIPDFNLPTEIKVYPQLWVSQFRFQKTHLNEEEVSITLSPQMTTIIGGPGSGKSSIFRMLRGMLGHDKDLTEFDDLRTEQDEFFKKYDSKTDLGVLSDDTKIELRLHSNNQTYLLSHERKTLTAKIYNTTTNQFESVDRADILPLINLEIYSQKQIFRLAKSSDSLRRKIDGSSSAISELLSQSRQLEADYLLKCAEIRSLKLQTLNKAALNAELKDIGTQITSFEETGWATLSKARSQFTAEQRVLKEKQLQITSLSQLVRHTADQLTLAPLKSESLRDIYYEGVQALVNEAQTALGNIQSELHIKSDEIAQLSIKLGEAWEESIWWKDLEQNQTEIEEKKIILEAQGIEDFKNFESLITKREAKSEELLAIKLVEEAIIEHTKVKDELASKIHQHFQIVTQERQGLLDQILNGTSVRMKVKRARDREHFEKQFRLLLQRETEFSDDIGKLCDTLFLGEYSKTLPLFRNILQKLRGGEDAESIGAKFKNLIANLSEEAFDKLEIFEPEDLVEVSYRPRGQESFKSLASASHGQKTSAILSFILSMGEGPLLLDQPEDDVASNLIFDLIVEQLRQSKQRRQIIIISHNANIPVNGDSEHIVVMNATSRQLAKAHEGTLEMTSVRDDICRFMEGGKEAFERRSERYAISTPS